MTFVEVLVVILIIGALAGLIAPALRSARRRADRNVCRQEITRLSLAVNTFANEDRLGDWPPGSLDGLGITDGNGVNDGNESLVVCLSTQRGEGPYFDFDGDRLTNMDGDIGPEAVLKDRFRVGFGDLELREYQDDWRTPYIYFPAEDYGKNARYLTADGEEYEATVLKDPELGMWPAPLKFVIWSCGPDGVNENGGGDDIVSWR